MGPNATRDLARSALARLAGADMDNDVFRREAAQILHRAIGFDGWDWTLIDPDAKLPTRDLGKSDIPPGGMRRFCRLLPEGWDIGRLPSYDDPVHVAQHAPRPVTVLSQTTGGDLSRDLAWREIFGPVGVRDHLHALLVADGTCWAQLHLGRLSPNSRFSDADAEFIAGVAPMLAARLRDGLRVPGARADDHADPEPGTIIVDEDLSLVAATEHAWRWVDRLGVPVGDDTEPLPGFMYVVANRVASSPAHPQAPASVRLQAADGCWVVVRVAPLIGAVGGYAITIEAARRADLAPLLVRAWSLTPRERDVARLVIDGLSGEQIARALFISVHTVRDHVKSIYGKTGVTRRQDFLAALAGQPPRGQDNDGYAATPAMTYSSLCR